MFLILLGLFKKIAIADMLAPYVEQRLRRRPARTSFIGLLVGVWAFAFQIYGDFSGYSDIARGSAYLLGIDLPENFNQPYLSRSITEFWRRWHISLSTWLRDYLYIPLGGNRGGEARDLPQPHADHAHRRPVARGRHHVRDLGRPARPVPDRASAGSPT